MAALAMARWRAAPARLLLLHEPTDHLDLEPAGARIPAVLL
ncbi:hypothetical protein [Pseudomonas chlororaphis]|nr:hypothetical protein [Pseudomonas chlororaphis]